MTGPLRLVVIDSGVDPGHPGVRGRCHLVAGPAFDGSGATAHGNGGTDRLGHGTAVAATILQFVQDVELTSLRVFDDEPITDFAAVLHALEFALASAPAFVNLSLGTTSLRHRAALERLVARAAAAGTRLIAPATYGGLPCDPGNLPGVEAVVADPNVLQLLPELRRHGERWLWFASPLPPRNLDGTRPLLARGDSLAVATVTGCLAARVRAQA